MIATLEQVSLNALPALRTLFYGGWIVRMGKGYSRRANSVQTYHAPGQPLDQAIEYCESLYRRHDLPVVYKMTAASRPPDLDQVLEARGYHVEGSALVQTCALDSFALGAGDSHAPNVSISEQWSDEWYDEFCRLNSSSPAQRETLAKMLQLIMTPMGFASLADADGVRACGLGVLQETYLGLYDIVVDVNARRRGHGRALVSQLLRWGKENGARIAYLQVIANNEPALKLYAQLGFVEQYKYWYRVRV